jgi:hypothetical protein
MLGVSVTAEFQASRPRAERRGHVEDLRWEDKAHLNALLDWCGNRYDHPWEGDDRFEPFDSALKRARRAFAAFLALLALVRRSTDNELPLIDREVDSPSMVSHLVEDLVNAPHAPTRRGAALVA